MRRSKRRCQRIHAFRRFAQRTGLNFGKKTERHFIAQIQQEKATLVEKQSNRVSVYDVEYEGQVYRVVYDCNRTSIVTVFPKKESA